MNQPLISSGGLLADLDVSKVMDGLDGDGRTLVVVAVVIGACVLVGLLMALIDSMHKSKLETQLKLDMLDRGLSVEDMERVLSMKPAEKSPKACMGRFWTRAKD